MQAGIGHCPGAKWALFGRMAHLTQVLIVDSRMAHLTEVLIVCSFALILEAENLQSPPGISRVQVQTPFCLFEERCTELIFDCAVKMNPQTLNPEP